MFILCAFGADAAVTHYVDYNTGVDGVGEPVFKTLAYAVAQATAGDEIVLARGTHVLKASVSVTKQLTIRGAGENWETLVVSDQTYRTLSFSGASTGSLVHNLTLAGSKSTADNHSEIYLNPNAEVTISNVVVRSIGANPTACTADRLVYTESKPTFKNLWMTNCVVKGTLLYLRGGPHLFENCVFADNETTAAGDLFWIGWCAPVVRNCTAVGNRLFSGSAVQITSGYKPSLQNCVIWNNRDATTGAEKNVAIYANSTATFKNVCTTPIDGWSGTGHLTANPMLYEPYGRILAASPCAHAAAPSCATAVDILGNPRGATPSMGAFEPVTPTHLLCGITASATKATLPDVIQLGCTLEGPHKEPFTYAWDFNEDGIVDSTDAAPSIGQAGVYHVSVTVTDADGQTATATYGMDFLIRPAGAATFYVDTENGDDGKDGMTKQTAWKNLAVAVDKTQVLTGDRIVLVKGTHRLTASVTVGKAITVCGEEGAGEVLVTSSGSTVRSLKTTASGVTLHSFTLPGSKDGTNAEIYFNLESGSALVSNIVVRSIGDTPVACTQDPLWYSGGNNVYTYIWVTNCLLKSAFANVRGANELSNWVVAGNRTTAAGSGDGTGHLLQILHTTPVVKHCTIVHNDLYTGAAFYTMGNSGGAKLYNNIIWGNYVTSGAMPVLSNVRCDSSYTSAFFTNCTMSVDGWIGTGNFSADPMFQPDGLHFLASSPCNHAADSTHSLAYDIDGNPRGATPSLGAFEYVAPADLVCAVEIVGEGVVRQPQKLILRCALDGPHAEPVTYSWDIDGDDVTDATVAEIEIADVGVYQPKVSIVDHDGRTASATCGRLVGVHVAGAATYYVDYELGDDENDGFTAGAGAWKTLAAMADKLLLLAGDEVVLAKGEHPLSSEVQIVKPVRIRGAGENWETRLAGVGSTRVLKLDTAGVLLSNVSIPGAASDTGKPVQLVVRSAAMVSNVMATASGGNLTACSQIFQGYSSGALFTHLWVTNCLFSSYAFYTSSARFENSLIADNRASQSGNVYIMYDANGNPVIRHCTIVNNEMYDAPAIYLSGNGIYPEVSNCIVWNNTDTKTATVRGIGFGLSPHKDKIFYNCVNSTNELTDASNITDDPLFRNAAARNYTLRVDSPCRNTGLNGAWSEGLLDLLGNPRRTGQYTDRGCFELPYGHGLIMLVR